MQLLDSNNWIESTQTVKKGKEVGFVLFLIQSICKKNKQKMDLGLFSMCWLSTCLESSVEN